MGASAVTAKYLWHLTLDTGHGRRSYRDEVDDGVVSLCQQWIAEGIAGDRVTIMPGYVLTCMTAGGALMATIAQESGEPLATVTVASSSLASAAAWRALQQPAQGVLAATGDAPRTPWCAARLYGGLLRDPGATAWLGDVERCLAWAWIERRT